KRSMSSAKGLAYELLDVFAEAPFQGNPVAVVFGAARLASDEMQAIARETNLSETTFVLHDAPRAGAFDVRIFTPGAELPYAGHPTLGTAAAIRARLDGCAGLDQLELALGIGRVPVRFASDGLAWLESPRARFEPCSAREAAAAALGLPESALDPELPVEIQATGHHQLFVPLRERAALDAARIDAAAYDALGAGGGPRSLYAFARGARDPRNHFSVRLFAPAVGVPEDPATGSAAGFFGAWLLRHRVLGDGPLDVRLEQGHAVRRPSLLRVRARGRDAAVEVGGRVIPVARGEWL
ncbi:MAG TPA: PhzF family phenazine biosynthesis protein, partial [Myxococcota bacterium]|nr:PhzF family phenazine biosynthesis protein [Myxococcota bacterium]